jgi:hypothetical protein
MCEAENESNWDYNSQYFLLLVKQGKFVKPENDEVQIILLL